MADQATAEQALDQCLDRLRDVLQDPGLWGRQSGADVLELVRKVESVARLAAAVGLDGIAEIDRRGLAGEHGCMGTAALLRQLLRLSPGEAAQRVQLALAVTPTAGLTGEVAPAVLPATAEAFRVGAIYSEHARLIQRTLRGLPSEVTEDDLAEAEAFLAHHARQLDPSQLRVLAARVRAYLDQDGTLREERDAVEDRELHPRRRT